MLHVRACVRFGRVCTCMCVLSVCVYVRVLSVCVYCVWVKQGGYHRQVEAEQGQGPQLGNTRVGNFGAHPELQRPERQARQGRYAGVGDPGRTKAERRQAKGPTLDKPAQVTVGSGRHQQVHVFVPVAALRSACVVCCVLCVCLCVLCVCVCVCVCMCCVFVCACVVGV